MIIATWTYGSTQYRLVGLGSTGSGNALERLERDAANGERWVELKFGGDRPGYPPTLIECVLLTGIRDLASKRDALAETMNYAKGERKG